MLKHLTRFTTSSSTANPKVAKAPEASTEDASVDAFSPSDFTPNELQDVLDLEALRGPQRVKAWASFGAENSEHMEASLQRITTLEIGEGSLVRLTAAQRIARTTLKQANALPNPEEKKAYLQGTLDALSRLGGKAVTGEGLASAAREIIERRPFEDKELLDLYHHSAQSTIYNLALSVGDSATKASLPDKSSYTLLELAGRTQGGEPMKEEFSKLENQTKSLKQQAKEAGQEEGSWVPSALTEHLTPKLLGEEEEPGLIARGRKVARQDPELADTEFLQTGARIAANGERILSIAKDGQEEAAPKTAKLNKALAPEGSALEWTLDGTQEIADGLEAVAVKSLWKDTTNDFEKIEKKVTTFQEQLDLALKHEQAGSAELPRAIKSGRESALESRRTLSDVLKSQGFFENGNSSQLFQEGLSPETSLNSAAESVAEISDFIVKGELKGSASAITSAEEHIAQAEETAKESIGVARKFKPTLTTFEEKFKNTESDLDALPTLLSELSESWDKRALDQAAKENGSEEGFKPNPELIAEKVNLAQSIQERALDEMDEAKVLIARDSLQEGFRTLAGADESLSRVHSTASKLAEMKATNKAALSQGLAAVATVAADLSGMPILLQEVNAHRMALQELTDLGSNNPYEMQAAIESATAAFEATTAKAKKTKSLDRHLDDLHFRAGRLEDSYAIRSSIESISEQIKSGDLEGANLSINRVHSRLSSELSRQDHRRRVERRREAEEMARQRARDLHRGGYRRR